jgi:hypothetical protein
VISAVTSPLFKLWRNATVRDKKITKNTPFLPLNSDFAVFCFFEFLLYRMGGNS